MCAHCKPQAVSALHAQWRVLVGSFQMAARLTVCGPEASREGRSWGSRSARLERGREEAAGARLAGRPSRSVVRALILTPGGGGISTKVPVSKVT